MKQMITGILALLALAGGTVASRAAIATFTPYSFDAIWTNSTATVWDVNGSARTTGGTFPNFSPSGMSVQTDGSGKITGAGMMRLDYNTMGSPSTLFVVDIKGRISSSVSKPAAVVTLNLRGTGFTSDATGTNATLTTMNLKFTGQPGVDPANANLIRIVGTLSGSIRGATPLGAPSARIDGLVAYINNSGSNPAEFSADVLQSARAMLIFDSAWTGHGAINTRTDTYKLGVRGASQNQGSTLALTGDLGSYTNNTLPNGFAAPVTMNAKGKVEGQAVLGTNAQISVRLITN
jgi:hypothetical protein